MNEVRCIFDSFLGSKLFQRLNAFSRGLFWTDCIALFFFKVNISERHIVLKETRLLTDGTNTATDYLESNLFRGGKLKLLKMPFKAFVSQYQIVISHPCDESTVYCSASIILPGSELFCNKCCANRVKAHLCTR